MLDKLHFANGLDAMSRVVHNLQDPSEYAYAPITSVQPWGGTLDLGSHREHSIARLAAPPR